MGLFNFLKNDNDGFVTPASNPDMSPNIPDEFSYEIDGESRMVVDDVFSIKGRGTVATGRIESGRFAVDMPVNIVKPDGSMVETMIIGIESFAKTKDEAVAGDNVGLLLANITRDDIERGFTVVAKK